MVNKLFICLLFLRISASIFGQNDFESTFTFLSKEPVYEGGIDSLKKWIEKNIVYPVSAINDGVEGSVYVSFWIDVNGKTKRHEVIRGIRDDLNQEALRVSRLIRFSKPAMQKEKAIEVEYSVVVKFILPPVFAQDNIEYAKQDSIEAVGCWAVEDLPVYQIDSIIGNFFAINRSLKKYIVYPINAMKDSTQGIVIVEFKVKKSGEIVEIKVAKGVRKDIDKEAVRIVKMVRCKTPARNRGKPVDYRETFVIPFRLSKNQH